MSIQSVVPNTLVVGNNMMGSRITDFVCKEW